MEKPCRVLLRHERGWKVPPDAVKVNRDTIFGNPFTVERYGAQQAVYLHRAWITGETTDKQLCDSYPELLARHLISRRKAVISLLPSLKDRNLVCDCPLDRPCHADTLLEIANSLRDNKDMQKVG